MQISFGCNKKTSICLSANWYYGEHPGWVRTASVGRSMSRFFGILGPVLRKHYQVADPIVWLAAI